MKKQFVLVGAIAVLGLGAFLVSCSKDDKSNGVCTCKTLGQVVATIDLSSADDNPWGAKTCSELTSYVDMGTGLITCN